MCAEEVAAVLTPKAIGLMAVARRGVLGWESEMDTIRLNHRKEGCELPDKHYADCKYWGQVYADHVIEALTSWQQEENHE